MGGGGKRTAKDTDAVTWNPSGPQLPTLVAILPFIVVAVLILCLIYKYLREYWAKKRKSDTYVFVGWNNEGEENNVKSNSGRGRGNRGVGGDGHVGRDHIINYSSDPRLNSFKENDEESEDNRLIGTSTTPSPTVYHQNLDAAGSGAGGSGHGGSGHDSSGDNETIIHSGSIIPSAPTIVIDNKTMTSTPLPNQNGVYEDQTLPLRSKRSSTATESDV